MAKRNSTRRKARKPKFIEIEGHQLTEAMHIDYERCVESRSRQGAGAQHVERLGLGDFLAGYRPSRKIERQLLVLSSMASSTSLAVGAMRDYTFYPPKPASIRSAGCKLLRELAQELSNTATTLTALAAGVEAEEGSKVQDWLEQARALEQIGCSQEFAHGNV